MILKRWLDSFHYVSISTKAAQGYQVLFSDFTFHYVSINTGLGTTDTYPVRSFTFQYVSINTTIIANVIKPVAVLYIPICFY